MKTLLNVPGGNLRKANDGMLRRVLFLSLMMLLVPFVGTDACTNLIVGKNASADGSTFLILLTHTVCLVSYIIFRQERIKKEQ